MSVRGVLALIIGGVAVFVPGLTMKTIVITIGSLIILGGVINILISLLKEKNVSWSRELSQPFLNVVFGLVLVLMPELFVTIIIMVVGIGLLLTGVIQLAGVIKMHEIMGWQWLYLIISLLVLTSGIVLLSNPFESAEAIFTFFGVIMMLYGISELIMSWKLSHAKDQYKGTNVHDIDHTELG
jgi:uncharacterized membrane protein HdeD (DUF308 family)